MSAAPLIAALLAGFALLTAGLWRWTRPTPSRGGHLCGRCGYDVRGLPTPVCPECGADLRVVGTVDPSRRAWKSRWTFIFAWTLLILVASLAAIPPQMEKVGFARRTASSSMTCRVSFVVGDAGALGALELFITAHNTELYWRGFGKPGRLAYAHYRVDMPRGASVHLRVDPQARTATPVNDMDQPLGPSRPFDKGALHDLAAANGRTISDGFTTSGMEAFAIFVKSSAAGVSIKPNSTAGRFGSGGGKRSGSAPACVDYQWMTSALCQDSLSPLNLFAWLVPLALWWLGLRLDRRRRMPDALLK